LRTPEAERLVLGRPTGTFKVSDAFLHHLDRLIEHDRGIYAWELHDEMRKLYDVRVSVASIENYRVGILGYKKYATIPKCCLSNEQKAHRMNVCGYLLGNTSVIDAMMSTDEKYWRLKSISGRPRVYLKAPTDVQRFHRADKREGASLMTWGGIHRSFATDLIAIEPRTTIDAMAYMRLLQDHVFHPSSPMVYALNAGVPLVFQQDGAGCHKADMVLDWLNQMPFGVAARHINSKNRPATTPADLFRLYLPGSSPDLWPEKVWSDMTPDVQRQHPTNLATLQEAVHAAWVRATTTEKRNTLFDALPGVLAKVVLARGDNKFMESRRRLSRIYPGGRTGLTHA
jgi:hypothetical protein